MARRSQKAQVTQAAKWIRNGLLWFLSKAPPMEMAALRSISANVSHEAALPGPRRSPPALWVPWGHVPPTWRPGGPCRRPHHARFGLALPPGGRRIHP